MKTIAEPRTALEIIAGLKVKFFADGADTAGMLKKCARPYVTKATGGRIQL